MDKLHLENWQSIWGLIILVVIPLLFIAVGFLIKKREKTGGSTVPPKIMRYLVLPTTAFHLFLFKILELPRTAFSVKVTETVLTIFVISFLFNAINYLFFSEKNIFSNKELIPKLGRDILHFVLIIIITACVLSNVWGLDLGNLLTALGVSSLVIGLALQEPLANLFNGVSLLMAKPFQKGDWINIGDEVGKVVEFNWRSVKITNRFNQLIIIPNNMIGKEKIKNLSRPSKIHAELVTIGFSYDDHPERVKEILSNIVKNTDGILKEPAPIALTMSYDDSSISYGIKFYVKDYEDSILLKDKIMTQLYTAAEENNLSIPFPKQEIEVQLKKEI